MSGVLAARATYLESLDSLSRVKEIYIEMMFKEYLGKSVGDFITWEVLPAGASKPRVFSGIVNKVCMDDSIAGDNKLSYYVEVQSKQPDAGKGRSMFRNVPHVLIKKD